jgi:hypothetical protein
MAVPEPPPGAGADDRVFNWRPGRRSVLGWTLLSIPLAVAGLALFAAPILARTPRLAFSVYPIDALYLVILLALVTGAHEVVHGLAMRWFGARPRFGADLIGGFAPVLFTTAPGHKFSRRQYLIIAVAPAVVISVGGFIACFTTWGGYLVVPLAFHLAGCTGDAVAAWHVLRKPRGTMCEDLRDGIRFYKAAA